MKVRKELEACRMRAIRETHNTIEEERMRAKRGREESKKKRLTLTV